MIRKDASRCLSCCEKSLFPCEPVQIVERGLQTTLVLEDDLRFEVFFKRRLQALLQEVTTHKLDWDLM